MPENQETDRKENNPLHLDENDRIKIGNGGLIGKFLNARVPPVVATTWATPLPDTKVRHLLREWWHGILGDHGRYACYAIFLVLPSDKQTVRYLTEYGKELDLISGENCLVIALSKTEFKLSGFDEGIWCGLVEEHSEGYSVKVAQLFDIDFTQFPCLIVFKDIRSAAHVTVALKGMTAEEIAEKMRSVFSVINKAISDNEDPLTALERQRNSENLSKAGRAVISEVRKFAGNNFETAMQAWIKAVIK